MLAWLLLAALGADATVRTVDDVLTLLHAGTTPTDVASAVVAAGTHLALQPKRAIELYFDGVPVEVLAAIFATEGPTHPVVTEQGREIELVYPGYRIVGFRGSAGAEMLITGLDRRGERLSPPVEPAPEVPPAVQTSPAIAEIPPPVRYEPLPPIDVDIEPPSPRRSVAYSRSWDVDANRGAPESVVVTRVPPGAILGASVTVPFGSAVPGAIAWGLNPYVGYGYGTYGGWNGGGPGCGMANGYITYDVGRDTRPPSRGSHRARERRRR